MTYFHNTTRLPYRQWTSLRAYFNWISWGGNKAKTFNSTPPSYVAYWIRKGEARLHSGSKSTHLTAGEWAFVQPNKSYTCSILPHSSFIQIGFTMRWEGEGRWIGPRELLWGTDPLPLLEEKTMSLFNQLPEKGIRRDFNIQLRKVDAVTYFWIRHLFNDWFATWLSEMTRIGKGWIHTQNIDERLIYIIRYMEERYRDQQVNLSDVAQQNGMSHNQMDMLFKKQYGMTPKAWLMRLRLEHALQQLRTTQDNIKDIAAQLGYSPVWFCVWIKQETGMTPSEIRSGS